MSAARAVIAEAGVVDACGELLVGGFECTGKFGGPALKRGRRFADPRHKPHVGFVEGPDDIGRFGDDLAGGFRSARGDDTGGFLGAGDKPLVGILEGAGDRIGARLQCLGRFADAGSKLLVDIFERAGDIGGLGDDRAGDLRRLDLDGVAGFLGAGDEPAIGVVERRAISSARAASALAVSSARATSAPAVSSARAERRWSAVSKA